MKKSTIGLIFAIIISSGPAWANTFTVNSTEDAKRGSNFSNKCYCKATNGYCTLRAAIETANLCVPTTSGDSDNVVLSSGGTYKLKLGEQLIVTKGTIRIYASGSQATIDAGEQDRIFYVNSGTALNLNNIKLLNGKQKDNFSGGAIFNQGTLTITKSVISGNGSKLSAGGIYNSTGATLELFQSTIESNTAANSGGAIYNLGTLTIDSSTVGPNNTANSGNGGGVVNNAGTATISNSTISGNTSKSGGGGIYNSGTITLTHATVAYNSSTDGKGGGIFAMSDSSFSLYNSIVIDNKASVAFENFDEYKNCEGIFSGESNVINGANCSFPNDTDANKYFNYPILELLADNGGPTKTHALKKYPYIAIDEADAGWVIDVDQRGFERDAAADIGAYEYIGKCGDGLAQKNGLKEQCDDSNTVSGDGCSATCQFEPVLYLSKSKLNFGQVAIGSEKSEEIVIKKAYDDKSILTVSSIALVINGSNYSLPYSGDNFSAEIQKCDTYPTIPYAGCTVLVKFHPAIKGNLQAQMTIKSNDPKSPEVTLSFSGEGYDDAVIVSPSNIIFTDAKLLETASQELVISNSGITVVAGGISDAGDFKVSNISCNPVIFAISPNESCTFSVSLQPKEVKKYSSNLKITTNHSKYPVFDIPLEATVTPPIISTDPAETLDFDKVIAGEYKDLLITISNSGASKSYLSYAGPASSDFSLPSPCSEVPAFGSCETLLRFHVLGLDQAGTFEDSITIISSDPQNPSKTIKLMGVAVAPKIQVSTTSIDFGNVIYGESKEESFNIINIGISDLTINNIELSDEGVLSISQSCKGIPIVIKPNETCEIKIKFSPAKEQFNGSITIYSDAKLNPYSIITILGKGVEKPLPVLLLNPSEISASVIAIPKAYIVKNLALISKGNAALTVTDVAISGEGFELLPDDATPCGNLPFTLQPDANCSYKVKFVPVSAGEYNGTLTITSDSGGISGTKAVVQLKGIGEQIKPEISVINANIDFSEIDVGSVLSDEVAIYSSNNDSELTISGIDDISDKENFSLTGKEACVKTLGTASDNNKCEFTVEFHPKSAGSFEAYTYIYSNDETNGKYKITFTGKAVGPGVLVDPLDISFSKVLVGNSLTWPVVIKDTSEKVDLKVTSITVSGTDYSLNVSGDIGYCDSSTPTIKAGNQCIVGVVFVPTSVAIFNGALKMTLEGLPDVEVKISGIGYKEDEKVPSEIVCGNGITEEGEACDDGNTSDEDDCTSECKKKIAAEEKKEEVTEGASVGGDVGAGTGGGDEAGGGETGETSAGAGGESVPVSEGTAADGTEPTAEAPAQAGGGCSLIR